VTERIIALQASQSPSVILVYVPRRWARWESFSEAGEQYDLHDAIKAYCVSRGISSQLLREATLEKRHRCEVLWWLALSFYVKSMRTPWVLKGMDADTAFVGIGFSLEPNAPRGSRIILGCSHLYNAEGLGLRYRLSQIENPIIKRGNPFMSHDDARRFGETTRQLCFEAMGRLPRRVVIHKRTPFLRPELEGLLEGLRGITEIDMLEITIDTALRYVASCVSPEGKIEEDAFPIKRGTVIPLEPQKAVIWVHGTTTAANPKRRYYLGKSRIPAPLMITRHHGRSSLSVLAREILGLSKMNWNTFDMYTKIPATIDSSRKIARIGSLLERFGPFSYDYRLFI
jgi:hypothetical protein